jgi:hypothetical protein
MTEKVENHTTEVMKSLKYFREIIDNEKIKQKHNRLRETKRRCLKTIKEA